VSFLRVISGRTVPAGPRDLEKIIELVDRALDTYAHVGIAHRFMIDKRKQPFELNARILHTLGYNLSLFSDPAPRFRMKTCSDIDVTMQIMASGRQTMSITEYCHSDGQYRAPGGCNTWRTDASILEGHRELQRLWPDYVKLREGPDKPGGVLATIYFKKFARDCGLE